MKVCLSMMYCDANSAVNAPAMQEMLTRAEALCERNGVKLTAQRRRVLELIVAAERPLGAYEILAQLGAGTHPTPPTVYRALDFLLAQGLIHKLASQHAYVSCTQPGHPHAAQFLICAACGRVEHCEDAAINDSLAAAEAKAGFTVSRQIVELIGTCPRCQRGDVSSIGHK